MSTDCNGNNECLEECSRQLRKCLDAAFPNSKSVELESDTVNYMLLSVFFSFLRTDFRRDVSG